jgi:hypothetical protein
MNSKVKVIIAVVCLVAAGTLIAMNMGLIGGSGKPKRTGGAGASQTTGGDAGTKQEASETEAATGPQLRKERI